MTCWQDEFKNFMMRLDFFPFRPREEITAHFCFLSETKNYLAIEFLLVDLMRIMAPMPTACRILSGIYDGVLQEETIGRIGVECLSIIEDGG